MVPLPAHLLLELCVIALGITFDVALQAVPRIEQDPSVVWSPYCRRQSIPAGSAAHSYCAASLGRSGYQASDQRGSLLSSGQCKPCIDARYDRTPLPRPWPSAAYPTSKAADAVGSRRKLTCFAPVSAACMVLDFRSCTGRNSRNQESIKQLVARLAGIGHLFSRATSVASGGSLRPTAARRTLWGKVAQQSSLRCSNINNSCAGISRTYGKPCGHRPVGRQRRSRQRR